MAGTFKEKCKELDLQYQKMHWLLERKFQLSVRNKLLLYKQIWLYGIQLWRCAANSNIDMIKVFQNKVLQGIVNTPWYFRNNHLQDLKLPTVKDEIKTFAEKNEGRLHAHENIDHADSR